MNRRSLLKSIPAALAASALALALAPSGAQAAYPDRPITILVPWAAGGGTDATARIIGSIMEKELGTPVNVVNRTGGSGVVGHSAIANAAPDGYTIGVVTVEINMMHWQGLTDLTHEGYTPIAQYNFDPAGLQVRKDAPYQTAKDLLDAVKKAKPGELKASGTGQGGIWHLALAGMLNDAGIDANAVQWVPSEGAAPGLVDLVAGGVDIVPCSLPEARSMMDAGRVRSLAVMADEPLQAYPDIPTLKAATGSDWTMGAWRGIAGPKGMPQEVVDKLVQTMQAIYESEEFKKFMSNRGYGMIWRGPEEFAAFMAQNDKALGDTMKAVGIAK